MTPTPNHASDSPVPELRRAATSLIMGQLGAVVDQDLDWLGVTRKRIKDRMSDAKHIMFNNEMKLRLIESQLEKGTASAAGAPPELCRPVLATANSSSPTTQKTASGQAGPAAPTNTN